MIELECTLVIDLNTFRDAMSLLQGALALAVVVTLVGADGMELGSLVNWNPFSLLYGSEEAGEGNSAISGATEGDVENLCTVLYDLMGHLATNNTFECQPLPSPLVGNMDEFCNFCAVDTVGYCKGKMNVPACLGDSLKVSITGKRNIAQLRLD